MKKYAFTDELWRSASTIYKAILGHPFIKGLADGSLRVEQFKFYVLQDALYLTEFAKTLSLTAAKAPVDEWIVTFNEHSRTAILMERSLHQSFFKTWGLTEKDVYSTPMSPTNLAYTTYLVATAYSRPLHELLAALLPCYLLYWEVGKTLEKFGSRNELYRKWIETYSSKDFAKVCRTVLSLADSVGQRLTKGQKAEAAKHFITTSRYEYMFWDSAYRLERWPV